MIRNFEEAQYFINVCVAPNNQGLAELKRLIWSSPNLSDIRDVQGNSLAHMAIQSGNDEVLKLLIATDPALLGSQNINFVGANILHFACFYARENAANVILDKAPSLLYCQDFNQNSPAHLAVLSQMNNFLQKALLKQQEFVLDDPGFINDFRNITDAQNLNPFELAIYHDKLDTNEALGIRSLPLQSDISFNNLDHLFLQACRMGKLEAAIQISTIFGPEEFSEMILVVDVESGKTIFHEIFDLQNPDYRDHERLKLAEFLLSKIPPDQAKEILFTKASDDYQVVNPQQNKVFATDLLSLIKAPQEVASSAAGSVQTPTVIKIDKEKSEALLKILKPNIAKIVLEEVAPQEVENQNSILKEQRRGARKAAKKERQQKNREERQAQEKEGEKMSAEDDYSQSYEKSLKQKIEQDLQQKAAQERESEEMFAEELLSKSYEEFLKQQKEQQMNQESEKDSSDKVAAKKRRNKKKPKENSADSSEKETIAQKGDAVAITNVASVQITPSRLNQITKRISEMSANYGVMLFYSPIFMTHLNFDNVNFILDRPNNITLINQVINLKSFRANSKIGSAASRMADSQELDKIFDELLRDPRIDIESKVSGGASPFLYACRGRHFDSALKLIDAGADVEVRSDNFFNALHYCAATPGAQSLEVAKRVSNAVDIDFIDMKTARPRLDSPASICCQVGNVDMLQLLLERGLSPQTSFVARFGETPSLFHGLLTQALIHKEYEAAKVLISHGADLFSNSSSYILPGKGAQNSFISVATVKGQINSPAEIIEELDYKTIKDLSKVISANFDRCDLGKLGPKLRKEVQEE